LSDPPRIRVVPSAAQQIIEAGEWWGEHRPAAPALFREEIERAFLLIGGQPDIGARASNRLLQGVRRVHLSRIGYHLYYRRTPGGDSVEILALWHARRGTLPLR
jgi:plasmid stabilization system protein ParE